MKDEQKGQFLPLSQVLHIQSCVYCTGLWKLHLYGAISFSGAHNLRGHRFWPEINMHNSVTLLVIMIHSIRGDSRPSAPPPTSSEQLTLAQNQPVGGTLQMQCIARYWQRNEDVAKCCLTHGTILRALLGSKDHLFCSSPFAYPDEALTGFSTEYFPSSVSCSVNQILTLAPGSSDNVHDIVW